MNGGYGRRTYRCRNYNHTASHIRASFTVLPRCKTSRASFSVDALVARASECRRDGEE